MALRKEGRSLAVYVVACSRRSDRGDNAKTCEQKKKQRGGGVGCVSRSLFLLALFSTAAGLAKLVERLTAEREVAGSIPGGRTNTQGLKNNREMKVLYMPPSVNDLVLRSLREEVSYFLCPFATKKKGDVCTQASA